MKHLYNFLLVLVISAVGFVSSLNAQTPGKFSYQAVMRDASDALLVNRSIRIRVSILRTSSNGTLVFSETHNGTTNANGLVTFQIGSGTPISGTINSIDWSAGPYFVKTETDPNGGNNFSITGSSELLSVPYALYAANGGVAGPEGPQGPQGIPGFPGEKG